MTFEAGVVVEPLSFFKTIRTEKKGSAFIVRIEQEVLDQIKLYDVHWTQRNPTPDNRISIETTYVFDSGSITRTDRITPKESLKNVSLTMAFAGFSKNAVANGSTVSYSSGIVQSFGTTGYQNTTVEPLEMNPKYSSPIGAMSSLVKVSSKLKTFSESITVSWTMKYQN